MLFRTAYNPEVFDQLFEPLVGDAEARASSESFLAGRVQDYPLDDPAGFQATDPYDRLQNGVFELIRVGAQNIKELDEDAIEELCGAANLGLVLSVAVAHGLGDVYEQRAAAPQAIGNVQRSTSRALSGVYALAFNSLASAAADAEALKRGRPRSRFYTRPLDQMRFETANQRGKHIVRQEAFDVTDDEAQQLDIRLRFQGRPPRHSRHKCPATGARIGPPGEKRSALRTLLGSIGNVAITEIYPHHIDLVDIE